MTVIITSVHGGAQEPQSGFLGREGSEVEAAGWVKVFVVSVVDVPVIMQLEFQQSASYENLEVPQFQLIVRVLDVPVVSQGQVQSFTLVQFLEVVDMPVVVQRQVPQLHCVDKVVDILVVTQRLIPMVPSVQMTTEIPLLQFLDKVNDVPGVRVMQVSQVQVVEETVVLPQFQLVEKIVVIPEVVDMPVGVQRQVPWGSDCRKLWRSRSCSTLIRWSMSLLCWCRSCSSSTRSSPSLSRTSSCGGYGGGMGFSPVYGHFSRSVHPDVERQVSPR